MTPLKLVALDETDLAVVSAHLQDAVLKVSDLAYLPGRKRFALACNRFVWENRTRWFSRAHERRLSALHFDRVLKASLSGIDRTRPDEVLSLLAITFEPSEAPAGTLSLVFSGGGTVRLDVECIEARLSDLGAAWETGSRPSHEA
jgi:hypothetical protein